MSRVRLTDSILPTAFNNDGWKFLKCEFDNTTTTFKPGARDQFQASIVYLTVTVQKNGVERTIPLVVKFEPSIVKLREYLNTNTQFYNEVFMYSKVLPVLEEQHLVEAVFPKYYYGVGVLGDSDSSVVLLQDLRPLGFKMTDKSDVLDYGHFKVAMEKLGKFHAMSYAAKKERPEEFYKLTDSLRETSWREGDNAGVYGAITRAGFHRAMDPLVQQGKHTEVLRKLLARVDESIVKLMLEVVKPDEPMAVINHGDFCRNNILYKYDKGEPVDVKFFDIATSRYSSPMVDITFFLFLNSTAQMRKEHLDDLLKVYHEALSTAIPGTTVPSVDDIRQEFKRKALYGFAPCSFFLPVMMYGFPFGDMEEFKDLPEDEQVASMMQLGGEEGTRLLSDLVEELIYMGCLSPQHQFLNP